MVMSLHKIRNLEDHKLLSGYIAMFLAEFDAAQAAFMESSHPLAALDVRHTEQGSLQLSGHGVPPNQFEIPPNQNVTICIRSLYIILT